MRILFDHTMRDISLIPNKLSLSFNTLVVFGNKITKDNKEYFKYVSSILIENGFLKLNISKSIFQNLEFYFTIPVMETEIGHFKEVKDKYNNPISLDILLFPSEHKF